MNKDWNIKWQSGTLSGTIIIRNQPDETVAYQVAQPALMAKCREIGLQYVNVTVEERKPCIT